MALKEADLVSHVSRTRPKEGGRRILPFVFQSVLVFLGVLGRKYPCDPASFFLRQVGRQRVGSGTTRPSGQDSAGGLTLVLKEEVS